MSARHSSLNRSPKVKMNNEEFVSELARLRPQSTFLNLHRYQGVSGEVANFNIIFHISYENALKRSVAILESLVPDSDLQAMAKFEVLQSYHTSIASIQETPIEEVDDAYTRFFNTDGSYIKGVKLHTATQTLHLYGLVHQKVILTPGVHKKVNSKPLTIEKEKLRRMGPVSKFRQFKILPTQVEKIKVEGLHLLPPE